MLTDKKKYSRPGMNNGCLPINIPVIKAPVAIEAWANEPFSIPGRLVVIKITTANTARGIKAVGKELLTKAKIATPPLKIIPKKYNNFRIIFLIITIN